MREFDLGLLKTRTIKNNRYEKRLASLAASGLRTDRIERVVDEALANIKQGRRSFVIYGEPQSGKTEMMIALTARALDEGYQIVVILLNDSVQLLGQNLERFQRSGLSPTPKKFSEVLPPDVVIGEQKWVIFCKKNAQDLTKLIEKLRKHPHKLVIDDEADYATPNSKINKKERSKINALTGSLIGTAGTYIGVTATPGRLDLNRTHDNLNECWIDLPPHEQYSGQDVFFPSSLNLTDIKYKLNLLRDDGDSPVYLRKALTSFIVNVAYLNTRDKIKEQNYSILVHTSGRKIDHSDDYKAITKYFESLREQKDAKHEKYYLNIWNLAKERYPGREEVITGYIIENNARNNIVVMNSDKEKNVADNRTATDPSAPFTVIIGGNIVSRGVTFKNLLSMFFTRDVKHKMQQDTYIQRARMFGARNDYLRYFELTIPISLFLNWQQCFIFHRLSLESRRSGAGSPVWLEGERVIPTGATSIDKAHVMVDEGEMSFGMFDYDGGKISAILESGGSPIERLKRLSESLGNDKLPAYLLDYICSFLPDGNSSIAVHRPRTIEGYTDPSTDRRLITRTKGFIGRSQLESSKYPIAIHHIYVLFNSANRARIFYKFNGDIKFLKTKAQN